MADLISRLALIIDANIGGAIKGMKELTDVSAKLGDSMENSFNDADRAAAAFDKDLTKLIKKIASGNANPSTIKQLENLHKHYSSIEASAPSISSLVNESGGNISSPNTNYSRRMQLIQTALEAENFRQSVLNPNNGSTSTGTSTSTDASEASKLVNLRVFRNTAISPFFTKRKDDEKEEAARLKRIEDIRQKWRDKDKNLDKQYNKEINTELEHNLNEKITAQEQANKRIEKETKNREKVLKSYENERIKSAKASNNATDVEDAKTKMNKRFMQQEEERDRNRKAAKLSKAYKVTQFGSEMEKFAAEEEERKYITSSTADIQRRIVEKQDSKKAFYNRYFPKPGSTGPNSFSRKFSYAASNAAYGIEDALTGYTVNGVRGAVLGASNNITAMMSTMISNPLISGFAVVGTAITAFLLPKFYELSTGFEEAAKQAEEYKDRLSSKIDLEKEQLKTINSLTLAGDRIKVLENLDSLSNDESINKSVMSGLTKQRIMLTEKRDMLDDQLNEGNGPRWLRSMFSSTTSTRFKEFNAVEAKIAVLDEEMKKIGLSDLNINNEKNLMVDTLNSDKFLNSQKFNKTIKKYEEILSTVTDDFDVDALRGILEKRELELLKFAPSNTKREEIKLKLLEEDRSILTKQSLKNREFKQKEIEEQEKIKIASEDLFNKIMNNNDRRAQLEQQFFENSTKVDNDPGLSEERKQLLQEKLTKDLRKDIKDLAGPTVKRPIGESIDVGSRQDAELFFRSLNRSFNSEDIVSSIKSLLTELQSMNKKLEKLPKPLKA